MNSVQLFLLLIIATGIGAVPKLFSKKHHHHASKGHSRHPTTSSLHGGKESLGHKKHASGSTHSSKSLAAELKSLQAHAEFLIEGVGQILVATDNVMVEDSMLEEMDDRLVLLYKYWEDDIDELLRYLKQVTDTTVMHQLKSTYGLDEQDEFIILDSIPVPDPSNVGDWATSSELMWS